MKKKRTRGRVRAFAEGETRPAEELRRERQSAAREAKPKRKVNKSRVVFTVIIAVMIAAVVVSVVNVFSLWSEQKSLKADREKLLSEKESLKEEMKNVNDVDYIEEQARMQLRLIKPGEILYILQGEESGQDKGHAGDTEKED